MAQVVISRQTSLLSACGTVWYQPADKSPTTRQKTPLSAYRTPLSSCLLRAAPCSDVFSGAGTQEQAKHLLGVEQRMAE
eukprot:358463-Rhodomonas_salina.1